MPYYKCSRIGGGSLDDPFRPAIATSVPTGGTWAATDLGDGTFLVFVNFGDATPSDAFTTDPNITAVSDPDALTIIQSHNPEADTQCLNADNSATT
jgi:hypothetical protein